MIGDGLVTEHAKQIWWSGVEAARADRLLRRHIQTTGNRLQIGNARFSGEAIHRVVLIGFGKAAEAMAYGFLDQTMAWLQQHQISVCGQLHIPTANPDVIPKDAPLLRNLPNQQWVSRVELLSLRPRGTNQTSRSIVKATQSLLELIRQLGPGDLVVSLISGGGSALLCSPFTEITVADQISLTKTLSENGANIQQLNTVRRCIDQVKCGGLTLANPAEHQISMVLSDVIGDDLATIASGPTWITHRPYREAMQILQEFDPQRVVSEHVTRYLESHAQSKVPEAIKHQIPHVLVGNNWSGVEAAAQHARNLGYHVIAEISEPPEKVSTKAEQLVEAITDCDRPTCIVSGGEPTLKLASREKRGIGGRNQQLAIEALQKWWLRHPDESNGPDFCFLSAGTDGEDGTSHAAGGYCDRQTMKSIHQQKLDLENHIEHNDAERLLRATENLLFTGVTHTNICDIRVFIALPK